MIKQRETFVATRAARLVLGVAFAAGLGATVVASPLRSIPGTQTNVTAAAFKPLGEGPAVSVAKAFGQHDEDCVTVTQVKGADGRVYASRGMVCAE